MKIFLLLFAFALSVIFSEIILVATAFAQSGAATGTLVNPSVPNGVESNPTTFENVQPVLGATPVPSKNTSKVKHPFRGGSSQTHATTSFVSPPTTMEPETPASTDKPSDKSADKPSDKATDKPAGK